MEDAKRNFLIQNGVDVNKGIENTMDFETYNEILLDFCNTFPQDVNKFNEFKAAGDMVNYQHELAAKQNDINYVNLHYNELINEVRKVYNILVTYKGMN